MIPNLGVGFALICFQHLSRPNNSYSAVPLVGKPIDQRFVQPGPLVLGSNSLKYQTPTAGRDQPVSRMCLSLITKCIGLYLHPSNLFRINSKFFKRRLTSSLYGQMILQPLFPRCCPHCRISPILVNLEHKNYFL